MLDIYTTKKYLSPVQEIIASEPRLDELVGIYDVDAVQPGPGMPGLLVTEEGIVPVMDWYNQSPPLLLPRGLKLQRDILLGMVFSKLGNDNKARVYLREYPKLYRELSLQGRLSQSEAIDVEEASQLWSDIPAATSFDQYRLHHNLAILHHYGGSGRSAEEISQHYQQALALAPGEEYRAFTSRHYGGFLLDTGQLEAAAEVLQASLEGSLLADARHALQWVLIQVRIKQLKPPYQGERLESLKSMLWETLTFYEAQQCQLELGLLLLDATHIAHISQSFTEALGYISRAISIFEEESMPAFAANAYMTKGTLLHSWAQQGQPQFYKAAIEAYQQALKVFRKEEAPDMFAEIHHQLGILYAEMPAPNKKRGIWAGVAAASFQEALAYYTADSHPYAYGTICNNYGNALMKFPPAIHSDNYEKALSYYQEALRVRTPQYPYERAISILNYLEASWRVGNQGEMFNEERYRDMLAKAKEIETLVNDADMLTEARRHLDMLKSLKETTAN